VIDQDPTSKTWTALEEQAVRRANEPYSLCLYVAGLTYRSTLAIERIRSICDRYLAGRYRLTIVDLYLHPEAARKAQVVVAPTLVKQEPAPMRLFVGDMTDEKRILRGLNIVT
jgi:circadian clock protein KaiB